MRIWIDDGDRRVRGQLRPYVNHCDTVLTQVVETWEELPMIEQGRRFTSRKPKRGDLVILVPKTKEDTWTWNG